MNLTFEPKDKSEVEKELTRIEKQLNQLIERRHEIIMYIKTKCVNIPQTSHVPTGRLTLDSLLDAVARLIGYSVYEFESEYKFDEYVEARRLYILLIDELKADLYVPDKKLSDEAIGNTIKRDRCTVISMRNSAKDWYKYDDKFRAKFDKLRDEITLRFGLKVEKNLLKTA